MRAAKVKISDIKQILKMKWKTLFQIINTQINIYRESPWTHLLEAQGISIAGIYRQTRIISKWAPKVIL